MSKVDKQALRELAEKATQGEWTTDCDVTVVAAGSDQLNNGYGICECHGPESRENVDFIAAANPAAILALLDEIEALRAMAGQIYQVLGALDAPENILDQASAAASGEPLPHATILPFFSGDHEALRKDAELYRALRAMHWHDSPLAVVRNPKAAIKPGHDCPSGDRLDEAILEVIAGGSDRG